ncbi:MAG: type IX secretion system membrane protein PorP/SprF [Bacteroidales bacterium]|jgi:type IX secretion system PorP/SprF family membrane protein|nr:type IX secretion system membrane protein PorP/SprF [Bacteroidales bacterium]
MKTRILYIATILLTMTTVSFAQQTPMYTQYMLNDFAYNPAIAGTKEYYQAKSNNRYQWIGITDAPRTYVLSVYGPHRKLDMGFGGLVFNDVTGPTSRLGVYGSYAYNVRIKDDLRFSSGLSIGLLQYKVDGSKITLHDEGDPSLGNNMYVDYLPDATMGIYFYATKYSIGLSVAQLFSSNVKFNELEQLGLNRLKRHMMLHGSYVFNINEDFSVEPMLMLKFVAPAPIQADINARVIYRDMIWAGFGYRTKDAASILVGYNYQDQLIFGYSYDMTFTDLRKYSSGTHELMIGARFNKIKQSKWRAKID